MVPELVTEALAEAEERDGDEAGWHQAHQQQPSCGPLHDEQVDSHGQRAEVQEPQHPHQSPGGGLAQQGHTAPHAPPLCDGRQRFQTGRAPVRCVNVSGGRWCRWRLHNGDDHKVRGAPDGGVRRGRRRVGHGGSVAACQRAQASGAEEQLRRRVLMEVQVPLIPALESQRCHQVAVVGQIYHGLFREFADVATERTHQDAGRRLAEVQDLDEALGAQTVAALEHLRPAAPQIVRRVADLTLHVFRTRLVQTDALAPNIIGVLLLDPHLFKKKKKTWLL